MMKKLLLFVLSATLGFGQVANDLILTQRKSDNSGNIQRNVSPTANAALGVNASKVPVALTAFTQDSATGAVGVTAQGSNQNVTVTPSGTGNGVVAAGISSSSLAVPRFQGLQIAAGNDVRTSIYMDAVGTNQPTFVGRRAKGTYGSLSGVIANDAIASYVAEGYGATGYVNSRPGFSILADDTWTDTVAGSKLFFSVTLKGGTTSINSLQLASNGSVAVGQGNRTVAPWGTSGIFLFSGGSTITDSTSSGTVASAVANSFAQPTFAASSATTFTNAANLYIAGDVAAGTNVTLTNSYGLWNVGKTRLDGAVQIPSTNTAGIQAYNTSDQVTNVQRFDLRWNSSNFIVGTKTVGTAAATPVSLISQAANGGAQYNYFRLDRGTSPLIRQGIYTSETGTSLDSTSIPTWWSIGNGTTTASSGQVLIFSLTPTLNNTGTAAVTDFLISTNITAAGSGAQKFADWQINGTSWYQFARGNAATTGAFNASSGLETAITLSPVINQTSTAGYTALKVNPTETGTGSGAKLLIDAQAGGVSKWNVSNAGSSTQTGSVTATFNVDSVQSLSGAGAVNVTDGITEYTSTGGSQALTLANGTPGQIKYIVHGVDGGSGILTPTTKTGYTTITFTNAGDSVTLVYLATRGWVIVGIFGAVAA